MADLDALHHSLTFKIVFYGPALSGKTTNLMALHDLISTQFKGELMTLDTRNDRTLFFDLMPLGFRAASGLLIKFKLFTVPGQVAHDATRKAVLSRADAVVFVADSQRQQGLNNGESFDNLAHNAQQVGLDFEHLPLVVQYNKRDLPDILTEDEIQARWGQAPWPVVLASAVQGTGVLASYQTLLRLLYPKVDAQFSLAADHGLDMDAFCALACGQMANPSDKV